MPASEFGVLFVRGVLQSNLAPRGRGGGQRAVRPISPRAPKRDGRGRTGASGGRVGERLRQVRPTMPLCASREAWADGVTCLN